MGKEQWQWAVGEYVVAEHKLEGEVERIKEERLRERWIHQRRVNAMLRIQIKELNERVEFLEKK